MLECFCCVLKQPITREKFRGVRKFIVEQKSLQSKEGAVRLEMRTLVGLFCFFGE